MKLSTKQKINQRHFKISSTNNLTAETSAKLAETSEKLAETSAETSTETSASWSGFLDTAHFLSDHPETFRICSKDHLEDIVEPEF